MSLTAESIKKQLLTLDHTECLELADYIYATVPDLRPVEYDEEAMKEWNRRSDAIDDGTAKGRDLEEIIADLGKRFG